jgi:hypothetical protein
MILHEAKKNCKIPLGTICWLLIIIATVWIMYKLMVAHSSAITFKQLSWYVPCTRAREVLSSKFAQRNYIFPICYDS